MQHYLNSVLGDVGMLMMVVLVLIGIMFRSAPPRRGTEMASNALYLAWAVAAFLILLLTWQNTERYLFFVFPALIVLGYTILYRGCAWRLPPNRVSYILVAAAGLYGISNLHIPATFLSGPSQAAARLVNGAPQRILYCGQPDGNFIFAARHRDTNLNTVVIRGEKLPPSTFDANEFEDFAHRFGIYYIVLEHTTRYRAWTNQKDPSPWDRLHLSPSLTMILEESIPLRSSRKSFNGELHVYRFTSPSSNPANTMEVPSVLIRDGLKLQF